MKHADLRLRIDQHLFAVLYTLSDPKVGRLLAFFMLKRSFMVLLLNQLRADLLVELLLPLVYIIKRNWSASLGCGYLLPKVIIGLRLHIGLIQERLMQTLINANAWGLVIVLIVAHDGRLSFAHYRIALFANVLYTYMQNGVRNQS